MKNRKKIIPLLVMGLIGCCIVGCANNRNEEKKIVVKEQTLHYSEYSGFYSFLEKNLGGFSVYPAYSKNATIVIQMPELVLEEEKNIDDYLQEQYLPQMSRMMLKYYDSYDVNSEIISNLKKLLKYDISELTEEEISDIISECYQNIQAMMMA